MNNRTDVSTICLMVRDDGCDLNRPRILLSSRNAKVEQSSSTPCRAIGRRGSQTDSFPRLRCVCRALLQCHGCPLAVQGERGARIGYH